MLAIGRALLTNPELLIMDEPSEGLAPTIVEQMIATCKTLIGDGIAILLVEREPRRRNRGRGAPARHGRRTNRDRDDSVVARLGFPKPSAVSSESSHLPRGAGAGHMILDPPRDLGGRLPHDVFLEHVTGLARSQPLGETPHVLDLAEDEHVAPPALTSLARRAAGDLLEKALAMRLEALVVLLAADEENEAKPGGDPGGTLGLSLPPVPGRGERPVPELGQLAQLPHSHIRA